MKLLLSVVTAFAVLISPLARAADGLIAARSPHSVKQTMDRFEAVAKERGMMIFARVDHAAGAAKVDQKLRPTEVLIFGNPKGGTPFMECAQSVGIDLPMKALAWQDAAGQVWLGYNDPAYIAKRHGAAECPVIENLRKALSGLTEAATAR